jgi:hypothetical protein
MAGDVRYLQMFAVVPDGHLLPFRKIQGTSNSLLGADVR